MAQLLQEYVDSHGVTLSVDREVGVLRGVKLIGLESRNGRRYRESALNAAKTLYEEAKVNVNHPKEGPLTPRDYQDRLGVIREVKLRANEGLFGDLYFNPKHTLAEQLLWDAEHNPRNVGFSHNVLARLSREGDIAVVEEITKVQSVDLVADPATTLGLFEQAAEHNDEPDDGTPGWDALTLEVLSLHRPDLLAEIQSAEAEQLQQRLDESQTLVTTLQKKQRVFELLCEHRLSISCVENVQDNSNRRAVSPLFVETLMQVSDEKQLEKLIAEQAALIGEAFRTLPPEHTRPFSRDQMSVLANRKPAFTSTQDFAETLKTSRN